MTTGENATGNWKHRTCETKCSHGCDKRPYRGREFRMLVLSRQKDQTIMIGDMIEITVVDIRGDKVRLGITAPTKIPVHRKEVYDAIRLENEEAASIKLEDITGLGKDVSEERQNKK
jgi:carbon storage regulator